MAETVRRLQSGPGYSLRRLGLINGLIIGIGLAAGIWLPGVVEVLQVPTSLPLASILVAATLVVVLCVAAGWLTGPWQRILAIVLLWLGVALFIALLVGYQPNYLRTYLAWLLDPRFLGRPVYPFSGARVLGLALSGFFIFLALGVLALLQTYRMEGLHQEHTPQGALTGFAWLRLLLPLPLVVGAGFITGNFYGGATVPLGLVDRAIPVTRDYDGDLRELGMRQGINYSALDPVRDQLTGPYSLTLTEEDPETAVTIVTAHFDSGAWVDCRLLAGTLSYCYDASPPYTIGLAALAGGEIVPEGCRNCLPEVDDNLRAWLAQQRGALGPDPQVRFVAQQGSFVLMRVEAVDGSAAIACWFRGVSPVVLESCERAEP